MASITRRRALTALGTAGLGALAGCASLGTATEPTLEYQLRTDRIEDIVTRALWTPPGQGAPWESVRREAWRAVTSGERYTAYGYEPVPEEYTEREGSYYHIDTFVTGSKRIQRPILRLEWVGRVDELDTVPEYVSQDDLPGIDQGAVMAAYFAARARENGGGAPWEMIEEGGHIYRFLDRADSELAPDPEHSHVRVHDTILKVSVTQKHLVEPAYTAQATQVASSRDAFVEIADAELVDARTARASLSSDAADIFRRSEGGDGYVEETPLSKPFRALFGALDLRSYLWTSTENGQLRATNGNVLQYGDEYYTYSLYVDEPE